MSSFLLSNDIIPLNYKLEFEVDIPAKVFSTTEYIDFHQNKVGAEFAELFADKMKIKSVSQGNCALKYTHEGQRLKIFGKDLCKSPVKIEYDGVLQTNGIGFYYVNDKCCSTQFEATHARICFPCFDEPSVKSSFEIVVKIEGDLMALSNMPVKSISTLKNGKKIYTFHKTPKMCTYLLAICIGQFDVLTGYTKRGMPVEIYGVAGNNMELFQFPLDEAINVINWYEDFIGIQFPLPKLQCIAIPEFQCGAMENYGLITFRETTLFAKPGVTSVNLCKVVSIDVAHEIAHQWCGDSVSPKLWDSLWLNEGFATIFPFIAFETLHPEQKFWEDFIRSDLASALAIDSSENTHPIHCSINSDEEIESVFDSICYSKAGCLIRMLINKIGIEKTQKALKSYFSEFQNSNADTDDLCNTFSRELGEDMHGFFDAWTKRTGYPLVILEEDLTLHQIQYTNKGLVEGKTWPIPLTILRSKDGVQSEIKIELNDKPIQLEGGYDWIKVNSQSYALCRTWHKGKNFTKLFDAIKNKQLPVTDRWAILNDHENLASIGVVPYGELINLIYCYINEDSFLVASEVVSVFSRLLSIFKSSTNNLKKFGQNILSSILSIIGKEPKESDSEEKRILRSLLLNILSFKCQDSEIIEYGKQLFKQFQEDYTKIDPNMYLFVLKSGCLYVQGALDYVIELTKSSNHEIAQCSLLSIGSASEENLPRILDMIFKVRSQDIVTLFRSIGRGPTNTYQLWNFLKENYGKIYEMFSSISFNIPNLIFESVKTFDTEEQANDVESFFKAHPTKVAELAIKQAVEEIRRKLMIFNRDEESVKNALKALGN